MGKPADLSEKDPKGQPAHWPFDPMQPGDHEPMRVPDELERVQKETGVRGTPNRTPKGGRR